MIALISWAAKKRPGHACRPYPKLFYISLNQSSYLRQKVASGEAWAAMLSHHDLVGVPFRTHLKEAGFDATYCARPSISGRSCLILENRNGSNTPGSGYRDSSIVMACVGMPIVVFAGIVKPEDNVSGLCITLSKVTAIKVSHQDSPCLGLGVALTQE